MARGLEALPKSDERSVAPEHQPHLQDEGARGKWVGAEGAQKAGEGGLARHGLGVKEWAGDILVGWIQERAAHVCMYQALGSASAGRRGEATK